VRSSRYNVLKNPMGLIAKLTTKLNLNGFPVTPEDNVKALNVLSSLPPDVDLETVGVALAGVYSRDEKTYEQFLSLWKSMFGLGREEKRIEEEFGAGEGETLSEAVARDIVEKMSRRINSKSLTPISTDVILR